MVDAEAATFASFTEDAINALMFDDAERFRGLLAFVCAARAIGAPLTTLESSF